MRIARTILRGLLAAVIAPLVPDLGSAQAPTWTRQFGTPLLDRIVGASSDGLGGVLVLGRTSQDLNGGANWLARYGCAGDELWLVRLDGDEYLHRTLPDGAGGFFGVGGVMGTVGGAGQWDASLARYDGSGNRRWLQLLGSAGSEGAAGICSDGATGVYTCGGTNGDLGGPSLGGGDAWIARHDATGSVVWIVQIGTPDYDFSTAVAPDGAGGVYALGSTSGSFGGPNAGKYDPWVSRHDGSGSLLWVRQLGSSHDDVPVELVPDGSGGVFLCGWTWGGPGTDDADAWVARYDGAGNELWIRQLGSSAIQAYVYDAVSDGAGGIWVCGITNRLLGRTSHGGYDAWYGHYDGRGNLTSIRQIGTVFGDSANALAEAGSGAPYLAGATWGDFGAPSAGEIDAWIARLSPACTPDTVGTAGCFGVSCPCGNDDPGAGCANSAGAGARLSGSGSASVAADDLVLTGTGAAPNSSALFYMGDTAVSGPFFDGRRCALGTTLRFLGATQSTFAGGTLALGPGIAAAAGGLVAPGTTWIFHGWYRDLGGPCGTGANLTSSYSVSFTP